MVLKAQNNELFAVTEWMSGKTKEYYEDCFLQ